MVGIRHLGQIRRGWLPGRARVRVIETDHVEAAIAGGAARVDVIPGSIRNRFGLSARDSGRNGLDNLTVRAEQHPAAFGGPRTERVGEDRFENAGCTEFQSSFQPELVSFQQSAEALSAPKLAHELHALLQRSQSPSRSPSRRRCRAPPRRSAAASAAGHGRASSIRARRWRRSGDQAQWRRRGCSPCCGSSPSSRVTATDWAANASFSSKRSISARVSRARSSTRRTAGTGPMPMIRRIDAG